MNTGWWPAAYTRHAIASPNNTHTAQWLPQRDPMRWSKSHYPSVICLTYLLLLFLSLHHIFKLEATSDQERRGLTMRGTVSGKNKTKKNKRAHSHIYNHTPTDESMIKISHHDIM